MPNKSDKVVTIPKLMKSKYTTTEQYWVRRAAERKAMNEKKGSARN